MCSSKHLQLKAKAYLHLPGVDFTDMK